MRQRGGVAQLLTVAAIGAALVFFLFPVYWMVATSFKDPGEYFASPPIFVPSQIDLRNYIGSLQHGGFQGIRDSLVVALASTTICVLFGSLAAYSLARFRTGGENLSFWVLSIRMFPPVASVLPLFLVFRDLHLLDTHLALIVTYIVFNLPFAIWLLKGFFEDLPVELEEAALVDGATQLGAFRLVAFPLTAPGLVATALFCFIFAWNEFMFALILTRNAVRTLPIVIPTLVGGHEILWGEISSIAIIAIVPVILLSLILQRYLIRGLTFGAVKG